MTATSTDSTTPSALSPTEDWSLPTFLGDKRSHFPGYLWEPFLPKQSVVMLAADAFSGKSMFCLGLGLALAEGGTFLGSPVVQANVLYVGVDSPQWDYGTQVRKLLAGRKPPAGFHFLPEPFRLLDRGWRARIGAYIQAHAIQLVVLDTLRAMHDKQENDSADMQLIMSEMRAIGTEYGVTVLFLHHRPKPNEGKQSGYRGSTVIEDSADVFVSMTAQAVGADASLLTLRCPKGRGVKARSPMSVKLIWDDDAGTAFLSLADWRAAKPVRSLETAVDARLAKGPATMEELVDEVPADGRARKTIRNKVDAYLQRKRKAGIVVNEHGKVVHPEH